MKEYNQERVHSGKYCFGNTDANILRFNDVSKTKNDEQKLTGRRSGSVRLSSGNYIWYRS
jgi:hypothetical protein